MACTLFFFFKVRGEEETETHIHNSQPYNKMPAAERNPKFVFLPPAVDGMSVSGGLVQSFAVVSSPPLGCLIWESQRQVTTCWFVFLTLRYHTHHILELWAFSSGTNPQDLCLCSQWTFVCLAIPRYSWGLDLRRERSDRLSRYSHGCQSLVYHRINIPAQSGSCFSVSEMGFSLQILQVWD